MKTYALFLGCTIPARVQSYEIASRAVLERLGVRIADSKQFTCCGYPVRNVDRKAFLLSAAQNLAVAGGMGCNILVLCKCCFGSLKAAQHILRNDPAVRGEIDTLLSSQGLRYDADIEVRHLLSVLRHEVGLDSLKKQVSNPASEFRVGAHYGCHALRPSSITEFDDPVAPRLFEDLVGVTGAKSVEWDSKMDCCGAPLLGVDDDLSLDLMRSKLKMAEKAGVDSLCTACPYCQIQFSTVQTRMVSGNGNPPPVPSLLYPQLLGLSMGIDARQLGLTENPIKSKTVS
jgi:heterodisulfide reductase subunit B